jgi:hypothetical protein
VCYDVRQSANATAAVRQVFGEPSGPRSQVELCAELCADSLNFAMENGRCLCADGLMAGDWPAFAVDSSQCGGACTGRGYIPNERISETLPCGKAGRLAIYNTAAVTELLAGGRLAVEQGARAADGARSSVLLAAAALSTALFGIARVGYSLTRQAQATRTPLV